MSSINLMVDTYICSLRDDTPAACFFYAYFSFKMHAFPGCCQDERDNFFTRRDFGRSKFILRNWYYVYNNSYREALGYFIGRPRVVLLVVLDWFYDSPPLKSAIFFNERFMAARHEERCYEKCNLHIFSFLQRTAERWRRRGKRYRISGDSAVSWFRNRRFR